MRVRPRPQPIGLSFAQPCSMGKAPARSAASWSLGGDLSGGEIGPTAANCCIRRAERGGEFPPRFRDSLRASCATQSEAECARAGALRPTREPSKSENTCATYGGGGGRDGGGARSAGTGCFNSNVLTDDGSQDGIPNPNAYIHLDLIELPSTFSDRKVNRV